MNFIKKILKSLFVKENKIKVIEEQKEIAVKQDKSKFIDSLKTDEEKKQNRKEIRTLTCIGDGLGIQKKISS